MGTKRTLAICDRCGLEYKLNELKMQVVNRRATLLMVCRYCLDEDHPQWVPARIYKGDPASIPNARPDLSDPQANSGFGWGPVGGMGLVMQTFEPYDLDLEDSTRNFTKIFLVQELDPFFILTENGDLILGEDS